MRRRGHPSLSHTLGVLVGTLCTCRGCNPSACGTTSQLTARGPNATDWLHLLHLPRKSRRACWKERRKCTREFISHATHASNCSTAKVLFVAPLVHVGLCAALNIFVSTVMFAMEYHYSVAMLPDPSWPFARGCVTAWGRLDTVHCLFQPLNVCGDFSKRQNSSDSVDVTDPTLLRSLMQRGEPTITLKHVALFRRPQPLVRIERFATKLGVPLHYIHAQVTRRVLRPVAELRAIIDSDLAKTQGECQRRGLARTAAIHVRASDAHTDGRGPVPASDYIAALDAMASTGANQLELHNARNTKPHLDPLRPIAENKESRPPTAESSTLIQQETPLCVFIASDVASINASYFEQTAVTRSSRRIATWAYVSPQRSLLSAGKEVAKQLRGNTSVVTKRLGSLTPLTIATEAIMDIFQLATSETYVGSYSNWALLVLALRLSDSLDPADPTDLYYRSVVLMNGNPSVPTDPYTAPKLEWDTESQKLAEHVPALHAVRDASTLFPHVLIMSNWMSGGGRF